jgi:hypothetical protein
VTTRSCRYARKLRDIFYGTGEKKITRKILNKLNPLGLALWYCDDGNLSIVLRKERCKPGKPNQYLFQGRMWTCSFSYEEHLLIQKYFEEELKLRVVIQKCKRKWKGEVLEYYYLRFPSNEFKKFSEIIKPYVPKCMQYKIDWENRIKEYENNINK